MGCCEPKAITQTVLKICILDITNEEDYDSSVSEIQTIQETFNIEPISQEIETEPNIDCNLWRMLSINEYSTQAKKNFYTGCDGLIIMVDNSLYACKDRLEMEMMCMADIIQKEPGVKNINNEVIGGLSPIDMIPKQFVCSESLIFSNLSQIEKFIKDDVTFAPLNYDKQVPELAEEIKRLIKFSFTSISNKIQSDINLHSTHEPSTEQKYNSP